MQEHDITATLVMELHPAVSSRLGSQEEKLWVGIVAHVRFGLTRFRRLVDFALISNDVDLP
jgi:hypothetical protein